MMTFGLQKLTCTLVMILRFLESSPQKVWLISPGTVYVCKGDNASLAWEYDPTIGGFDAASFYKIKPVRQLLVSVIAGEPPLYYTSRVTYQDGKSGITLDNVQQTDNGTYELEVNFDKYTKLIYDQAIVIVISGCPMKGSFERPVVLYQQTSEGSADKQVVAGGELTVDMRSNVTLIVTLPLADPPVTCLVRHGNSSHSCTGKSDQSGTCEVQLYFGSGVTDVVIVILKFIAWQPSVNEIGVKFIDTKNIVSGNDILKYIVITVAFVGLVILLGCAVKILWLKPNIKRNLYLDTSRIDPEGNDSHTSKKETVYHQSKKPNESEQLTLDIEHASFSKESKFDKLISVPKHEASDADEILTLETVDDYGLCGPATNPINEAEAVKLISLGNLSYLENQPGAYDIPYCEVQMAQKSGPANGYSAERFGMEMRSLTPLQLASKEGDLDRVERLCTSVGFDPKELSVAIELAEHNMHFEVFKLLSRKRHEHFPNLHDSELSAIRNDDDDSV